MKICFVILGANYKPVGGYKIVYEYANRLAAIGYDVSILYLNDTQLKKYRLPEMTRKLIVNLLTYIEPRWFKLNNKIKKLSNQSGNYLMKIKNTDVCIATAIETVPVVQALFKDIKKIYFIQDYETWNFSIEYVNATYSMGMKNIVISHWLKNIVDKYSNTPSILIQNPIDIDVYKVINPIEKREKYTIGILYHQSPCKGFDYALECLKILKKQYPQLVVIAFGTSPKPKKFPGWIKYVKNASQQQTVKIYNSVSIFLCASIKEGYGLTGLESMACGAAFVSTEYESVHEYADNGVNSLLSPIMNSEALATNVSYLFQNDLVRKQIAYAGVKKAQEFSWKSAVTKMEECLKNRINE